MNGWLFQERYTMRQWKSGWSMKSTKFGRRTHRSCMTWWWPMRWNGHRWQHSGFLMLLGMWLTCLYIIFLMPRQRVVIAIETESVTCNNFHAIDRKGKTTLSTGWFLEHTLQMNKIICSLPQFSYQTRMLPTMQLIMKARRVILVDLGQFRAKLKLRSRLIMKVSCERRCFNLFMCLWAVNGVEFKIFYEWL